MRTPGWFALPRRPDGNSTPRHRSVVQANALLQTQCRNRIPRTYGTWRCLYGIGAGHRPVAATCLYAAAFKPNSWARKLLAAKTPLRLNLEEHLRAPHRRDMRNGRRNWMRKILVVYSGWTFRNSKPRAGVASVAVARAV
ncbi:hypothetical protein LI328DRAFT_127662 [Trichoderma asperelloides]|nr:hypothetical protein LI328DRAFT_127662 [Trichoderma asperelloides]